MLYSADALGAVETIRWRVGRKVREAALDAAKADGRTLVTDDDVWAALESLGMAQLDDDSDEEPEDGR